MRERASWRTRALLDRIALGIHARAITPFKVLEPRLCLRLGLSLLLCLLLRLLLRFLLSLGLRPLLRHSPSDTTAGRPNRCAFARITGNRSDHRPCASTSGCAFCSCRLRHAGSLRAGRWGILGGLSRR